MRRPGGSDGSPGALLDGFHAAIMVSILAAGLGAVATAIPFRAPREAAAHAPAPVEAEPEAEAA